MRTARLAGLTRGARCQGPVPVRQVEEVTVSGAVDLLIVLVVASVAGGIGVAGTLHRAEIERLGRLAAERRKRMAKRHRVQRSPALLLSFGQGPEFPHRRSERRTKQAVAGCPRIV